MSFLLIADLQFVRVRVSCKGRIYMYNISTEEGRRGLRVVNASRGTKKISGGLVLDSYF